MTSAEPLNPVQQDELLQQITARLVHELPVGWKHIQVDHRALGDHAVTLGLLRMVNGGVYGWTPPEEVGDFFGRLRAGMARPERGTWLQATFWLDYPDSYQIEYNRAGEPRFSERTPPPGSAARELELFPRTEENTPDWLRAAVAADSD